MVTIEEINEEEEEEESGKEEAEMKEEGVEERDSSPAQSQPRSNGLDSSQSLRGPLVDGETVECEVLVNSCFAVWGKVVTL